MRFFPVNLDVRDKPVVIVGGGTVASRKCRTLIDAGSRITIISPTLTRELQELLHEGRILHVAREFRRNDLTGAFLVFAATSSRRVNQAVAEEARSLGIIANIADDPEHSSFISPSFIARGDLLITVSTEGRSPSLSRKIREHLEASFGPEYETVLEILGAVREKLLTEKGNSAYNRKLFSTLADLDLTSLVKNHAIAEIDHILLELFGPGFSLAELGVREKDRK